MLIRKVALGLTLATLFAGGNAFAQTTPQQSAPNTSPGSATTANPELQRQLAPQRRAMKRQKRAACEQEAAQNKLHLVKRWRFVRQCLKRSSSLSPENSRRTADLAGY
jgi:hypothetical protein